MAFNGSGVFNRLYNWVNDAAANIKIRADRMDEEFNGMATGLSTCITKDGQTTITANLPMAGFKHTGVAAGAARTEYPRYDQVQDGKTNWAAAGGTADAITAAYTVPLTALVDGQLCFVRAGAANATTTPTFSPDGITARTIVKKGGAALAIGDIAGAGHELELRYNLANTRWELLNPVDSVVPVTVAKTANYTVLATDREKTILCDASSGAFTVTLLAAATAADGFKLTIYKTDSSINAITVDGNGSETINGALTYTIPFQGNFIEIITNGTAWFVVNKNGDFIGQIIHAAGPDTYVPYGFLAPYGQAISRTTYAAAFAVLGTLYGVGDGSTTFNLPDARGRVLAGKDDMGGSSANRLTGLSGGVDGDTLGAAGGAESVTLSTSEIPSHQHQAGFIVYASDVGTTWTDYGAEVSRGTQPALNDSSSGPAVEPVTANAGGGSAHNNVQPTMIANVYIRVLV